jgi:membrane associated rhomboid family serine protease
MSESDLERPRLGLADAARPVVIVALVVAVMWAEEVVDLLPHTNFDRWGIRPRQLDGLIGIPLAPFLHAGFAHLIGNTIPFLILGGIIAASGIARFFQVAVIVTLCSGVGTWLFGAAHSDHIGASGVVFGFLTYLVARGIFARKPTYLIVGAVVAFVYGGILWGLVPKPGISWTGHLFGALGGIAAARLLHGEPRKRPDPAT